jgi:hypothetical protein
VSTPSSFAPQEIRDNLKKEVGFLLFSLLLRSDHPLLLSGRGCRKDNSEVDSRKGRQDVLTRFISQEGRVSCVKTSWLCPYANP